MIVLSKVPSSDNMTTTEKLMTLLNDLDDINYIPYMATFDEATHLVTVRKNEKYYESR